MKQISISETSIQHMSGRQSVIGNWLLSQFPLEATLFYAKTFWNP